MLMAEKHWAAKMAAGFTNGASRGGDKQNSRVQLITFATQHQTHWVNLGLNYGNNRSYTNEDIQKRDSYTLGGPAKPTRIRAATSLRQLPISAPRSSLGAALPRSHRSFWRDGPCSAGKRCAAYRAAQIIRTREARCGFP
jgi:hypothetical protein